MANNKHISEDEIKYIVDVESAKAQQEIRKIEKATGDLRAENKRRLDQMIKLEAAGKKESQQYRDLKKLYNEVGREIKANTEKIAKQTNSLKVNCLTMNQLKKQAKQLQKQLDDTSKSLNPDAYIKLEDRLKYVTARINQLKDSAKGLKGSLLEENTMSFLRGSIFVKLAEFLGGKLRDNLRFLISDSIELAESADGVAHAFNNIDKNAELLENLRKSTKGTVNDFELMKAAVQAKDFRIPLEDLGKYLAFAQLKAQQTGQSVEYMTNSIVTGLGRKSKMILDNLGISAAEIDEKIAETGDFMKAVASIVENQLADAGETYVSAADRALRKTTDLQNAQMRLGQALLPWKEAIDETFGGFQINILKAITYLLTHRKTMLAVTVAVMGFSVAMIALNAQIRNYIVQTKVARAVTIAWQTAATTMRGIGLLMSAAIATFSGNTTRATAAMKLFNKTCKANVYVALATAIIAAGTALYGWITRNKEASKAVVDFMSLHKKLAEDIQAQNNSIKKSVNDTTSEQITKIKSLRKTINDANESYDKRKAAIQDLQKLVPGYHASINGEGNLFKQNTKIIDSYINKLKQAALAEVAYERIKENQRKIMDAQDNIDQQKQNVTNIKANAKRKTGVDLDTQNIGDDGMVRFNDVHNDKGQLDRVKLNYAWDPGDKTEYLKVQQRGIADRTQIIRKEEAIVKAYSAQNDRLWKIVKENGGQGQSILNPTFLNHEKNTGSSADKVGQEQKSAFANERNAELDAQEKLYNQAMEALKQNLIQRKISQEQYNSQALAMEMAHTAKIYDIEKGFTEKARQLQIKDSNDKQRIVLQQQDNEEKARRAFQQKHLDAMQQYYDAQKQLSEAAMIEEERRERNHKLQLDALEAYYKAAVDYAKAHGEDVNGITQAYEQAKAKLIRDYEESTAQTQYNIREQYGLVKAQEQYERELALLREHLKQKKLTQEQYNEAVKNMERDRENKIFSIREQYGLISQKEIFEKQKLQLQEQRDEGFLSEVDYQDALKNLKMESWKQQFDYYSQLFGSAFSALQEAEIANVDAKYDAEIEAARQAGEDTTDIENKKANEKLKIQKKYADVNFAIKASQIIADTAVSIMKAISELGPIAGPIAAALMGVTGAAQLAAANAEREKVKRMTLSGATSSNQVSGSRVATGLEDGGSIDEKSEGIPVPKNKEPQKRRKETDKDAPMATGLASGGSMDIERKQDGKMFHAKYDPLKRGYIDHPTVIVGEGPTGKSREWVASNAAVTNPTVAPLIDIIDRAQRVGTISTLDMRKYLLQQQVRGLQQGGYMTGHAQGSQPAAKGVNGGTVVVRTNQMETVNPETITRLLSVLERLETRGIKSFVALDELDAQQKLRSQSRKIGSKT